MYVNRQRNVCPALITLLACQVRNTISPSVWSWLPPAPKPLQTRPSISRPVGRMPVIPPPLAGIAPMVESLMLPCCSVPEAVGTMSAPVRSNSTTTHTTPQVLRMSISIQFHPDPSVTPVVSDWTAATNVSSVLRVFAADRYRLVSVAVVPPPPQFVLPSVLLTNREAVVSVGRRNERAFADADDRYTRSRSSVAMTFEKSRRQFTSPMRI